MGATRLLTTSDELYELRHARYLARREKILATAKISYQRTKDAKKAALRAVTAGAREARLLEKRRTLYGQDLEKLSNAPLRRAQFLREYKTGKSCLDCQLVFPHYVMDFDHVRGRKTRPISELTTMASLRIELPKCDLVCANCHRIRTFARRPDVPK